MSVITADLVRLDVDLGSDKNAVIRSLAEVVSSAGRTTDPEQLVADAFAREATSPTGLKGGIAIPHCRTTAVAEPTVAFARLAPAVDFGAKDGPADLVFLIAAPDGGGEQHLQLLTKLARALVRADFLASLRAAGSPAEAADLITGILGDGPAATPASTPAAPAAAPAAAATPAEKTRHLVAVTACPTGIAHTYMAAEALEAAAGRAGVDIQVETQGSAGSTPLPAATIAAADAVIFAVDVGVRGRERFAGKPLLSSGVKRPIDDGDGMIAEALRLADDPNAPRVAGDADASSADTGSGESRAGKVRRILMTGVSYMIPFVAAGGLLIALGFLLGGYDITNSAADIVLDNSIVDLPDPAALGLEHALFNSALFAYLGALLFVLGSTAFSFLVPALAGYIAFAIADRPGIAPGFVMGAIAGVVNSGFLGGIVGGVLAGMAASWIAGWKVPVWARGLMPVLVIPLGATLIAGFILIVVLGKPLAWLMQALSDGLSSMSAGSSIILGVILGLMMAFDMGGPLNKTAYAFATAGLGAAATVTDAPELKVMAAVMLAGMVPPLALALATAVRPKLFTVPERENGKAAWLMGASFITEGAIPFAAADPLRIIPPIMVGSAVTGGLAMALDVTLRAPHGGIFVLFAVGNVVGFLISLVAGTLVASALVLLAKSTAQNKTNPDAATAAEPVAA